MGIDTNRHVAGVFVNGTPLVLNSNANPTNSYALIHSKSVVNIHAEDISGLTSLPDSFQQGNTNLKTVEVANTIQNFINHYCFQNCTNLEKITYQENSVFSSLNFQSFYNSPKLKEVIFPNSLRGVDGNNFTSCSGLRKLVFGTGITSLSNLMQYVPNTCRSIIIVKPCSASADVPTASSSTFNPQKFYFVDQTTLDLFKLATNWTAMANKDAKMQLLHTIYLDNVAHYIGADNASTIQQGLQNGDLADMESQDLTENYEWYTDSGYTTLADLTATYVDGLVLYGKPITE